MSEKNSERLSSQLMKSGMGVEVGLSPVLLGLLGLWIDSKTDTTPLFFLLFFCLGVIGVGCQVYYRYQHEMKQHEEGQDGL